MAEISGSVTVTGFIAPTDDTDTYAVTDPVWGKGALRTVADTTERDAISTSRREEGMLVYVEADGKYYKLNSDLTSWTDFGTTLGSSGTDSNLISGVTCDSGVAVGDVVRMSSGTAVKAQADTFANSKFVGTVSAKASSTECTVRVGGISDTDFSGLTESSEYYLSADIAGEVVEGPPDSGFAVRVGIAFSATRMIISKGETRKI